MVFGLCTLLLWAISVDLVVRVLSEDLCTLLLWAISVDLGFSLVLVVDLLSLVGVTVVGIILLVVTVVDLSRGLL